MPIFIEQSSGIKFLVAEKCKPCGIYRKMCDVYREAYFSQQNIYKWVKHGFFHDKSALKTQSI